MSESLWNSPITRRYVSSLIFEYEKTTYSFGENQTVIALLPTLTPDESSLLERDTFSKIKAFWSSLESKQIVKMHSYIRHLETLNIEIGDGIEIKYFEEPFEQVEIEKETKVEVLDIKALRDLNIDFQVKSDPDLSLISGLVELSRGLAIHLNNQNAFVYHNNKYKIRLEFGSQAYFVLASVIKHNAQGNKIVPYQQIADDVYFPITKKQKDYSETKQIAERNRKISNCVKKISKELERVMESYAKDGPMEEKDMVAIISLPKVGVKLINPVQF